MDDKKLNEKNYSFSFKTPSLIAYTNILAQHGPDSPEAKEFIELQASKGEEEYQKFLPKVELLNTLVRNGELTFDLEGWHR